MGHLVWDAQSPKWERGAEGVMVALPLDAGGHMLDGGSPGGQQDICAQVGRILKNLSVAHVLDGKAGSPRKAPRGGSPLE